MELFSKADDCHKLAFIINNELQHKVSFEGSTYQEVVSGTHNSFRLTEYLDIRNFERDKLSFDYKFCENGFLRITISKRIYDSSLGHKLAALSNFYMALRKHFGEPTLLYTIQNDDEESLSMQWSFSQKEEDIRDFKNNTVFDDAKIEHLVLFNEEKTEEEQRIQDELGLPIELSSLVASNLNEYLYYKNGRILNSFEEKAFPNLVRRFK